MFSRPVQSFMSAAAAMMMVAGTASAQCASSIKVMSSTPSAGDEVGAVMSYGLSNGDQRLAVGAPEAEIGGFFNAGKVKLFARFGSQWGELTTITKPTQAVDNDRFGASVGFSDGRVIIGAPGHQTNRGIAYIYEFQGAWTPVATISSSQTEQGVGAGVAIDGEWAFIGAPGTDTANNINSGLVSIQRRAAGGTWSQTQTVSDTDFTGTFIHRNLGAAVAVKNGVAVIGAPNATEIGSPAGHGYVKILRLQPSNQWTVESDYFAPGPRRAGAHAGEVVATDGVRVAIAAPDFSYTMAVDGFSAQSAGSVWVARFSGGSWVSEGHIQAPTPTAFGHFGASVAIAGDRLMVASPGVKTAYAYRLVNGSWVLDRAFTDDDSIAAGAFASSVALSDTNVFIGDTGDDQAASNAGAVYIKALPAGYSDSCQGAFDLTAGITTGCTIDATPDAVPTCGTNALTATGNGVWYAYTPACSGSVTLHTGGSAFDTLISVHTGCNPNDPSQMVACDDDSHSGTLSQLTFQAAAGTRYLINVRGYAQNAGSFQLTLTEAGAPANDTCSTPMIVASGTSYSFSNCNATTTAGIQNTCASSFASRDVWFRYTAPATGTVSLTTNGSSFDTILSVFSGGACPAAPAIACDDDGGNANQSALSLSVTAGSTYLIRVAGYSTTSPIGDGLLHIGNVVTQPSCTCDWNNSGALSVQDIFDFLASYFGGNGDFNASGQTTVQDIFDFLACYFGGCN